MRRRTTAANALAAAALVAAASAPMRAADGRIPIHHVPTTITAPGSYYLTRDIDHFGGGESITIQSSDVTIDFNGHTLHKDDAGNYTVASDGDYTNLTIRNGTIDGGNIGIRLSNTVSDGFDVRIEKMSVRNTLNEGIQVRGHSLIGSSRAYIERNTVHDTGDDGIHVRFAWGGRIADNVVQNAGDNGIYAHSVRGMTIRGNDVSRSADDGVALWYSWHCAVDRNHMTYGKDYALYVFDGDSHVFSNNRAVGNANGVSIPLNRKHVDAGGNSPAP
jgi:parallel beta-helix repeat protein